MTMEVSKKQKVLLLSESIELWMDEDKADALIKHIESLNFDDTVNWEGRNFTKSMYRGVFLPVDMDERSRRRNWQWKCTKSGKWHDKGDACNCATQLQRSRQYTKEEAIRKCGKCDNGWISGAYGMKHCECIENI